MENADLQKVLEATLSMNRPSPRDVRDALVDYFAVVAGPFIRRGLEYTQPDADGPAIRRLYELRLQRLWSGLESAFDAPTLADLAVFRQRIEQYACVDATRADLLPTRRLIDDLMLAVTVRERLDAARNRAPIRKLWTVPGGGETSAPRGQLRLVTPVPSMPERVQQSG